MSPAPTLWPHVEQPPPMKIPNLVPIDLSKADRHTHPDIKPERAWYLVRWRGGYYVGVFERSYDDEDLVFFPNGANGGDLEDIYFSEPGWNQSRWEAVWEMQP